MSSIPCSDFENHSFDQRTKTGTDEYDGNYLFHRRFAEPAVHPAAKEHTADHTHCGDQCQLDDVQIVESREDIDQQTDRIFNEKDKAHLSTELIAIYVTCSLDISYKKQVDAVKAGGKTGSDGNQRHDDHVAGGSGGYQCQVAV